LSPQESYMHRLQQDHTTLPPQPRLQLGLGQRRAAAFTTPSCQATLATRLRCAMASTSKPSRVLTQSSTILALIFGLNMLSVLLQSHQPLSPATAPVARLQTMLRAKVPPSALAAAQAGIVARVPITAEPATAPQAHAVVTVRV
jgi:hypothetical protein